MDWPTLVMRRAKKDPVEQGGWNLFMTGWGASDNLNPMYFAPLALSPFLRHSRAHTGRPT